MKVGTFHILDSFKITNRGLVVVGDIIEGQVTIGNIVTIVHEGEKFTLRVDGIEFADRMRDKEGNIFSKLGLFFKPQNEGQKKTFEIPMKIAQQTVDIFEIKKS